MTPMVGDSNYFDLMEGRVLLLAECVGSRFVIYFFSMVFSQQDSLVFHFIFMAKEGIAQSHFVFIYCVRF